MNGEEASRLVLYRLDRAEERLKDKADAKDVERLAQEVGDLKRALYAVAGSVLVSAVIFALAVFQLTG